jgi:hypothetical protein
MFWIFAATALVCACRYPGFRRGLFYTTAALAGALFMLVAIGMLTR